MASIECCSSSSSYICSLLETHFSSAFILSEEVRKRTESAPPPPEQNHAASLLLDVSIARPWTRFIFYLLPFSVQRSVELLLAAKLPPLPDTSHAMSRVPCPACPLTSSVNPSLCFSWLSRGWLAGSIVTPDTRATLVDWLLQVPGVQWLWTIALLGEDF